MILKSKTNPQTTLQNYHWNCFALSIYCLCMFLASAGSLSCVGRERLMETCCLGLSLPTHCPAVGLWICSHVLQEETFLIMAQEETDHYSRTSLGVILLICFLAISRSLATWVMGRSLGWVPSYIAGLKSHQILVGCSHKLCATISLVVLQVTIVYWRACDWVAVYLFLLVACRVPYSTLSVNH